MLSPKDKREEERLTVLRAYNILDTPSEERFDRIVRMAARLFGSPIALISLIDHDRQWFKAAVGLNAKQTPRDISFCTYAIEQREVFVVADAAADPRFAENPLVKGEPHIGFYAGAPLITPGGHAIGTVCVIDREPLSELPGFAIEALQDYAATVIEWLEADLKLQMARDTASRTRAIVENATDGIITIHANGAVETFNPAAARMFGYSPEEVIGRNVNMLVPEPYRHERDGYIGPYLRTGKAKIIGMGREATGRRKDGSTFPMELTVGEMTISGKRMFTGIVRDISERKKAEAELTHLAERAQLATVGAQVGIWDWDIPRDRLAWEPIMYELFNVAPGEFKGVYEGWITRVHTNDVDAANAAIRAALSGEKPYDIMYRVIWKNGETHWIRAKATVTHDASGKPLRMIGTCWDITDFQHAQAEVKALNARLEDRVKQAIQERDFALSAFIEQSPVEIAMFDNEMRYIAASERWIEKNYNVTSDQRKRGVTDLVGKSHYDILPNLPEHWVTAHRRGLAGETLAMAKDSYRREDGSAGWLRWELRPWYRQGSRKVAGIVIFSEDISEQIKLEAQLNQAQRMQAIGQLTGGIAHDFNNLLGVVISSLDMAELQVDAASGVRPHLDRALTAALRGSELVSQLMAFSRQKTLEPQCIDVGDHIAAMEKVLTRTLGEIFAVKIMRMPGLRLANVDPAQFDAALLNLAINARDAMPRGGSLTIETRNAIIDDTDVMKGSNLKAGDYICVSVSDTGTGMPPEVVARIFEPFFTTKEVGKGTGLGLSMVHGFVTQSGGDITVASRVGQGTTFSLFFPAAATVLQNAGGGPAADLPCGSEAVLVVEDNPALQTLAEMLLKSFGYRVHVADNGAAALAILEAGPVIDVLFTDVILPGGMTGIELAESARKLRPGLKVLYTSGYTAGAISAHFNAANSLAKPYRIRDLAQKVRDILDGGA